MPKLRARGCAVELHAAQRLRRPIGGENPHDPLHQFILAGLRPLPVACCWSVRRYLHRNLVS